jgi:type III restriction enzyme
MFEDTKEEFTNRIHPKRDRKTLELDSTWFQSQILRNLWDAVSPRTLYHVEFKAEDFSGEAVLRLKQYGVDDPISDPVILLARAQISMTRNDGVQATSVRSQQILDYTPKLKATDILTDLQEKLPISRSAILQVINESQRKVDLQKNPEKFKRQVKKAIDFALANTLVNLNAINYSKVDGPESNWPLAKLSELPTAYSDNMVATSKSIYGHVVVDSDIERDFAIDLNSRRDVLFFLKFPDWFKIETPLGGYNPDWAVVQESPNGAAILHLVRETKGSLDLDSLRFDTEKWKIVFGFKHFETLGVDYSVVVKASDLNNGTIPKFEN